MEAEIKGALSKLLAGIAGGDAAVIAAEMETLELLAARGRGTLDPQLQHFLERRSYAKAVQFLGGATDIPAGLCGGRARPAR